MVLVSCKVLHLSHKTNNQEDVKSGKGKNQFLQPDIPGNTLNLPSRDTSGLTDLDSNHYRIITIGRQIWMAENLRVTRYNDGTPIEIVNDTGEWAKLTTGAYSWFGNDSAQYSVPFGALYNWYAVDTRKLCPPGWHVPENHEWEILADYLGGSEKAGGKLKDADTTYWDSPNTGATNESGFTALPGGGRGIDGVYGNYGLNSIFWSSTEFDENFAMNRSISHYLSEIYSYGSHKKNGFSVRCLKDR
jgi:uncharacterized protein (TIGR02145 family)